MKHLDDDVGVLASLLAILFESKKKKINKTNFHPVSAVSVGHVTKYLDFPFRILDRRFNGVQLVFNFSRVSDLFQNPTGFFWSIKSKYPSQFHEIEFEIPRK